MNLKSNKTELLISGITSMLCSRTMFLFFNDPEGPNLLVVTGMAAIIYFLSLAIYYLFNLAPLSFTRMKRLMLIIFIQIIIVTGFYFCLN